MTVRSQVKEDGLEIRPTSSPSLVLSRRLLITERGESDALAPSVRRGFFFTYFVPFFTKSRWACRRGFLTLQLLPAVHLPRRGDRLRHLGGGRGPRDGAEEAHAGQADALRIGHGPHRQRPPALRRPLLSRRHPVPRLRRRTVVPLPVVGDVSGRLDHP